MPSGPPDGMPSASLDRMRIHRFVAILITALALTMTSAHVLEMPQKLAYDLELYGAVNASMYRYFAIVGGVYEILAILLVVALAWRGRHAGHARWRWAAAFAVVLAFVSWLILVQPVNSAIAAGASWTEELRARWEYGHLVGFVLMLVGFIALVYETVLHVPAEEHAIHVETARTIRASPERLAALYLDFEQWPRVWPETIRGTQVLGSNGKTSTVDVEHATAGTVRNVVTVTSPREIVLEEEKPRYKARFVNRFMPASAGSRYVMSGDIVLRGPWRFLGWLARPVVRRQMQRYTLAPMQRAAESTGTSLGAWLSATNGVA